MLSSQSLPSALNFPLLKRMTFGTHGHSNTLTRCPPHHPQHTTTP